MHEQRGRDAGGTVADTVVDTPVGTVIHTPDRRVRVFVSSTLGELRAEREAVRAAVESLNLVPVMFELGARPHPPRELYRAYLRQSDVFLGMYAASYGWVAPGEEVSGLEDEYRLAGDRPRLLYIKTPVPDREPRLQQLLQDFAADDHASYKRYADPAELGALVRDDLAVLLSESFEAARRPAGPAPEGLPAGAVPLPANPILGREPLLQQVEEHLLQARLVTLTGTGGIGKTRLATEVALRRQAAGEQVLFASLAESQDASDAVRTVQAAVGGHVAGAGSPLDSILIRLADQRVLLCLDNLEQIDGVDAVVATMLQRLPGLRVLATSRRALRLRAEQEVRVPTLEVPRADGPDMAHGAAVELFVARARGVDARFAVTPDSAADVGEIVRRLDGLPLAVELAAARTRVLSTREVLSRLEDCFAVLVGGHTDLPARQRTLRTTLDWSHALLSPEEQAAFARLGVFAGSWSVAAAETVVGDGVDAVDCLAGLLDNSLVVAREVGEDGEPRFEMLRTVRSYAVERLEARGETDLVRDRLLRHVRALGRRAAPHLCGPGQREWLHRLEPDLANIREAVEHALDSGRPAEAVDLLWDVIVHYLVRDAVDEPRGWAVRIQERRDELDEVSRARIDALHVGLRLHCGDDADARPRLEASLQVFQRLGLRFEAAVALHTLGFVLFSQEQDADGAVAALRESSSAFDAVGHDWGVSLAEAKLGSVLASTGAHREARAHLATSLARARRISSEPQEVLALVQLAFTQVSDGDWPGALDTLRESVAPLQRARLLADVAMALDAAASLALHAGRRDVAGRAVAAAARTRTRLGVAPWPTWSRLVARLHERCAPTTSSSTGEGQDPFDVLSSVLATLASVPAPQRLPEVLPEVPPDVLPDVLPDARRLALAR